MIELALPKGRMERDVFELMAEASVEVTTDERTYRPRISLPEFEAKILKPQNIVEMLHCGSRDLGFAGADWVSELQANVVELLDTELNPVRLVAAAPEKLLVDGKLPSKHLVIASEYERLARTWIEKKGVNADFVRSYGATEVFPPEDADCIVDNTATGSTLRANQLVVVDEIMHSSTRLYANPRALDLPEKKRRIDEFLLLLKSVLDARKRVMLEVNVEADRLEELVALLPCMREPTVSSLHKESGYAIKVAVPKSDLPKLILKIKAHGGTDIVVTKVSQLVA